MSNKKNIESIYHAGVDVDLVGTEPGAGEAGFGLEAGAASVAGVLVVDGDGDWGGGLDTVLELQ